MAGKWLFKYPPCFHIAGVACVLIILISLWRDLYTIPGTDENLTVWRLWWAAFAIFVVAIINLLYHALTLRQEAKKKEKDDAEGRH